MDSRPRVLHARSPHVLIAIAVIAAVLIPIAAFAENGSSGYALMVSQSPNRTSATALSGAHISNTVYVFLTPESGIAKATFWLDDTAMTGAPTHVEGSKPFDFAGTDAAGMANPWDSSKAAPGNHTISVKIDTQSGSSTLTTAFVVGSGIGAPAVTAAPVATLTDTPTPTPTSVPTAAPTPMPTPAPTSVPAPTPIPSGFVGRAGTELVLGGRPFTFTGFNVYQANSRANCSYTMGTGSALDTALTGMGPGANVFRAWFFQRLATTNGQRDWSAFDHTLAVARAHGFKVVVTLGNQWGSCESSSSQYKWDSWYTGGYKTQVLPQTTVSYRQYVQEIVSRYKGDPTIAMWQLMNEAEIKKDNTSTCAPASDLYNFAADVSGLIKSIDPNHLVSLGTMGGGQCGSQGTDYRLINSPSTIDVCEFHDYGHELEALPANLARDISACNSLNKPIFVGESGIKVATVGGTLAARAAAFDAKCNAMFRAGIKGFLIWSWNNSASTSSWQVGPNDPTIKVIDTY